MIIGLFFAFLIAAMAAGVTYVVQAEGAKISAALSGTSRPPLAPTRPVTVRWEKAPSHSATRAPLAAAA